jgi:hypothetical protein
MKQKEVFLNNSGKNSPLFPYIMKNCREFHVYIKEVYSIQMNDTSDGQTMTVSEKHLWLSYPLDTSSLSLSIQTLRFTWMDRHNILQGTGFCLLVDRIVSSTSACKLCTREEIAYCA